MIANSLVQVDVKPSITIFSLTNTHGWHHAAQHIYAIQPVNTLRARQNGQHFSDDIFKCIFLNENISTAITISLKFVPKGPINSIAVLVQIMAWCRTGVRS